MRASLSDKCGTDHAVYLELSAREIDLLIQGLQQLREGQDHFHCFQKDWEGDSSIFNIEFYCTGEEEHRDGGRD